jgi:hypothetical protein
MCPKSPKRSKQAELRIRAARVLISGVMSFAAGGVPPALGQGLREEPVSTAPETSDAPSTAVIPQEEAPTLRPAVSAAAPAVVPAQPMPVPPVEPSVLSSLLSDAATDLGLAFDRPPLVTVVNGACPVGDESPPGAGKVNIRGTLELREVTWWLRVAVTKDDTTTHSASVALDSENYEVQAIRTLALTVRAAPVPKTTNEKEHASPQAANVDTSQGKATLATHGAALGGYFGFALESAGGDVDTRLVYPLVALGAGVGLATALIVAEEWPVDRASAWYISGGSVWLTLAGVMIASEQDLKHPTDRYPYGLIGTAAGLGVSTLVVSQRDISEGEAVFSHSGAIFGAIVGGFAQELADPVTGKFPRLGVGVGTAGGWLLASLGTARLMPRLTATRVLFADLGGFLGALVGAAAASPAVVNQEPPRPGDRRAFVGASLGGLVLGSVVGYWLGGSVDETAESFPVSLRATTLGPTMAATPFDPGLPAVTAFTLHSQW